METTIDNVLKYLTDAYPNVDVAPATLRIMKEALGNEPGPFLKEAAERHVRHSRWFPTVAELMEQLAAVREHRESLADILRHERLARRRQTAAERPFPPMRDPRCLRLRIYYTDEELYEMEVARGTMLPPEEMAKRDEELARIAAPLRRALKARLRRQREAIRRDIALEQEEKRRQAQEREGQGAEGAEAEQGSTAERTSAAELPSGGNQKAKLEKEQTDGA